MGLNTSTTANKASIHNHLFLFQPLCVSAALKKSPNFCVLAWKMKQSLNSGSGPVPRALACRGRRSSGRSRISTSVTLPWKRGGRLPRRSKETMSCSLLCRYSTEKQRRVAMPGGGATTSFRGGSE